MEWYHVWWPWWPLNASRGLSAIAEFLVLHEHVGLRFLYRLTKRVYGPIFSPSNRPVWTAHNTYNGEYFPLNMKFFKDFFGFRSGLMVRNGMDRLKGKQQYSVIRNTLTIIGNNWLSKCKKTLLASGHFIIIIIIIIFICWDSVNTQKTVQWYSLRERHTRLMRALTATLSLHIGLINRDSDTTVETKRH